MLEIAINFFSFAYGYVVGQHVTLLFNSGAYQAAAMTFAIEFGIAAAVCAMFRRGGIGATLGLLLGLLH